MKTNIKIKMMAISYGVLLTTILFLTTMAEANELKLMDPAPIFKAKKQDGSEFDLSQRKGHWTVLFFYPKAGTPGCTKQACAFRDSIDKIKSQGADVFGISGDTVESQAQFHKEHRLSYDLLADPEAEVIKMYGSKIPIMKMSKRWTFIIDPDLKIRAIEKDVDPSLDANRVAAELTRLKGQP